MAGHRAAGMTMRIVPAGALARSTDGPMDAAAPGTGHTGHSAEDGDARAASPDPAAAAPVRLDLAAPFSPGWKPYDATLEPAPGGAEHAVEIRVDDSVVREVAPGVRQRVWTFDGTVPGPVLRGKIGDVFTVTFVNGGTMSHGIDFHAGANAPDGVMRTIAPGERLTYRFRAEHAGAWLYHCSTMPMTQHIAGGMYGAVVIDPPDLARADREFLLVQGELHLGEPGGDAQVAKIREGRPDGWMFNGTAAGYDHAPLKARAGSGCGSGRWPPGRARAPRCTWSARRSTRSTRRAPTCCAPVIRAARRCWTWPRPKAVSPNWSSPSRAPIRWWTTRCVRPRAGRTACSR
nr:hypothetical protein GCM10020093_007260 [Planobispora longispora]